MANITFQGGQSGQASLLTGMFTAVARHDFIAALLAGPDNGRGQHTILFHALRGLLHDFIIPYFEWVVRKWVQLRQGDGDNH